MPQPRKPRKPAESAAKKNCKAACCAVTDARKAEIAASVVEGRGRSMFAEDPGRLFGANCRCGVPRKPPGLAKHVEDDGTCVVHPDKPPQRWMRGAGRGDSPGTGDV